ncbi:MAG TPA: tail fiber domain-containing protein [Thermoanaerobaculia bacterium]|nr:tail fiber domain-containing protein [Thermoanaerobaculia bacterium]
MKKSLAQILSVAAFVAALAGWSTVAAAATEERREAPPAVASMNVGAAAVEWMPGASFERFVLTVRGPGDSLVRQQFASGEIPSFKAFDEKGQRLPDGVYTYELQGIPHVSRSIQRRVAAAREAGDETALAELEKSGELPHGGVQSGTFAVQGGAFVTPGLTEDRPRKPRAAAKSDGNHLSTRDQVIADDLIVQGSACIGLDCVNNESFGFDTIRLKENNTRIKFDDTSTATGFPNHDWQLTANDSASGGANKFSIEDITAGTVPFTVTGSAPGNAIFVDSTGRVGFRTSTPVLDLHVATSNTPAMRLEQNSSGGFTAQTWDIAGNEANFFVRDVTGGSRLPFRIRPGAPTSSIDINASGNVGVGTASPSASLHVSRSDATAKVQVQETNGTAALRNLLTLTNNGGIQILLDRTDGTSNDWQISNFSTTFAISIPGSPTNQMVLTSGGDMTISGTTYNTGSSREIKENFSVVSPVDILQKVVNMPLTAWNLKAEPRERHIGPIAEDWWATFGLGMDDKHVSMTDVGGVALAAIKGLHQVVREKDASIAKLQETVDGLQKQNSELAGRLAVIEQMLQSRPQ